MKRILNLLAIGAAVCLSSVSCMVYSDKDISPAPDLTLSQESYYSVFPGLFRVVEMADFFSAYQLIRSDRDASLALWREYFGNCSVSLYYEEASLGIPWGDIRVTGSEDTYLVSLETWGFFENDYLVTVHDGSFTVSVCKNDEVLYVAEMSVAEGVVYVNSLNMVSDDGAGTEVAMKVVEPVAVSRCQEGAYAVYPEAGAISYVVRGKVNDEFVVRYDGNGCVIERDGTQASYK